MTTPGLKRLRVDVDAVAQVMDGHDDPFEAFLDTDTGELLFVGPNDVNQRAMVAAERKRYKPIPRLDSDEAHDIMQSFVANIDDDDLRSQAEHAMEGKGAFRRFRAFLDRNPATKQEWFAFKADALLTEVREWLESIDIEPPAPELSDLDGKPVVDPEPSHAPSPFDELTVVDVALLGSPDGAATKIVDGHVMRVVNADTGADAAVIFRVLARSAAALVGEPQPKLAADATAYTAGRVALELLGSDVRLKIAVAPIARKLFG